MRTSRLQNVTNEVFATPGTTHEQNTISSSAEDVLNQALVAGTEQVFVQFTGAGCRVTFDGTTNPTASLGFEYGEGSTGVWDKVQATKAKAIRSGSTDCVIEYQELAY